MCALTWDSRAVGFELGDFLPPSSVIVIRLSEDDEDASLRCTNSGNGVFEASMLRTCRGYLPHVLAGYCRGSQVSTTPLLYVEVHFTIGISIEASL